MKDILSKVFKFESVGLFRLALITTLAVVCLRFYFIDDLGDVTLIYQLVFAFKLDENILTFIIAFTLLTFEFAILPFLFVRSIDWILDGFKKK
tara:strand:- start:922 stop:1200 length:279 start_codon:yes stop_codon:yes gene_type:complete